jgi:uncharacterized protein DUF4160
MPTIDRVAGYRIFFYSKENDEPPHVHVEHERGTAKFWLAPVSLARARGLPGHLLHDVGGIIRSRAGHYLERWNAHFGPGPSPRDEGEGDADGD